MACEKITRTNGSESKLIKTLEHIFNNEFKAEEAYAYFDVPENGESAFVDEFGDWVKGYEAGDPSFAGRVYDNGEPKLFYNETAKKHYFLDKNGVEVFYPLVKRGLRGIFDYKQIDKITSRLALNYFKQSPNLNFNNIKFEEGEKLPKLKDHIESEIKKKIAQLQSEGMKGKIMSKYLAKSLDHLDEYVDRVDNFYKQINIKRVDNDEVEDLQVLSEEGKDPLFNKASFERDSKDSLSSNIKLKLSLLENKEDLDPVWNEPTFVPFNDVYSTLINNISNQVALPGEDIFALQRNLIKKISYKKDYLNQLIEFFNDPRFTESDKNQFAQAFNLHKQNYLVSEIKTKFTDDNNNVKKGFKLDVKEVSESGSKATIIESEWGNNFRLKFLKDDNSFKSGGKESMQKVIADLKELIEVKITDENFKEVTDKYIEATRVLGIELSQNGFDNYLDDNGTKSFNSEHKREKLSTAIKRTHFAINKSFNYFKKAHKDFKNPYETQSIFKEMSKAESFFMSEGSESSIWTSGKNKWLYSYPSYLSTRILQWKKNPELLKNWYEQSAYNRGSALAKYLLGLDIDSKDEFGNKIVYKEGLKEARRKVSLERLDKLSLGVFNTFQEVNGDFVSSNEISFSDYFNDNLNKVLSESYIRTTTPADKSTDLQIRNGLFVNSTTMRDGNIVLNRETLRTFFNYFNSEFNRMKEASSEVDAAKENPENLKIHYHYKAGSNIYAKDGNAFSSQYFPDLSFSVRSSNYAATKIKEHLYNQDGSVKHTADLSTNQELRLEIENYINDLLQAGVAETISTLLNQEVIDVDKNGDYTNELIDRNVFKKYMENNVSDSNNAVQSAASDFYINGLVQNIEYSKLFTGDVAFYKNMVDYKKRIPGTYTDGLQLRLKEGEETFTVATIETIERESPVLDKLVEMLGEEGAKPYKKINSADAQAWITPARWRFLLERLGKWDNKTHDAVYDKMTKEVNPIYSKDELKIMAQPLKGVYFYMNGKTPTYLKYSQAVLTKGLVQNTGLEKVFDAMEAQEVDEVITIDGFKVGSSAPTAIHNSDGKVVDNIQFNKIALSNYGWKLQQDLPIKTFKQTDVGSQIQKNIFGGLKFNTKEKGFDLDGKNVTGQDIIDGINKTVKSLIDKGVIDIGKEFGIGKNGKIHNVKGLYNALVRELERRGGSKNIIDALNKQVTLYGMPQSIDKIISIYSSIMNDRLIKIKTNGGAFIQMSNFGISKEDGKKGIIWSPALDNGDTTFEPTKYIDEDTGRTKIRPGGILISGSFIAKYIPDYKKYDAKELFGYVDEEGNKVEGIIDEKILKNIVGYRIPNQGLSSNDALQIVGILPEENGDTIVAYTGITTKTGSDFDIDKMFIMMSNYTLEEGKLKYTEYDPNIPDNEQSKEAIQNRLVELYKAVLTHPKVIKDVMKPVDIKFIENDIKDLVSAETDKTMFHFDAYNDIKLRYEFIGGKAGVGQEANALVDINRIGNLSLNKYYIGWGHSQKRGDYVETVFDKEFSESLSQEDLDYYVAELKPKDESALINEISKVKIGDSLTAILNAFVDIAKDPYITRGNWTTSTTNIGNLLLRAGMHPLYVTAFMAQPIIKQYIQYQSSLESITSKNSGNTELKFRRNLVLEEINRVQEEQELPYSLSLLYQKVIKKATTPFGKEQEQDGHAIVKKALGKESTDAEIKAVLDELKKIHDSIFDHKRIALSEKDQNGNRIYNLKHFRDQVKGKPDGAFQIAIYDKFIELRDISKSMKENVDVSKLDTNGMGKNINSLYSIFNLKQHVLDKEKDNKAKVLSGLQSKFDNTTLGHYYEALEEMMRIVQANPNLFPQGQKKVQDMFNTISMDLYDMPAVDETLMTDLEKNYYTYTMSNFNPFNLSEEESRDLLNNLPSEFLELKKEGKTKYMILDELQIKRDGKIKIISLNNRKKSTSFEEKFTDSWRDLRLDHPIFAENLIKYSFLTSGFRMNANQFYTYIPNEYMIHEGINYFVPKFSKVDQTDFIDKFYLNNTHNFRYVPKVFENEMAQGDKNTGFTKKESGKSRFYVQLDENHIYKLEGYDEKNRAIYLRVNPLGKKVKGSNIVEYGEPFIKRGIDSDPIFVANAKDRVVTQRDKFNPNFILEPIENRVEDVNQTSISKDFKSEKVITKDYKKPWKSDPTKSNNARSFSLASKPKEIFELVKDAEDDYYSIHFKTTDKNSLTEDEKDTLIREVAEAIPYEAKLSTWGTITKGGISGLNRFKDVGFVDSGETRVVKDSKGKKKTIPVLVKEIPIQTYRPVEDIKEAIVEKPNVTSMSEITNHSGGAYGADTYFDVIGREFGVTEHKHYREGKNTNLSQKLKNAKVEATVLSKEDMDVARAEVEKLLGKKFPDTLQGNLQVRNYYQVANSDAVFAVAEIAAKSVPEVYGGTNTAVSLGIKMGKPVYVWDLDTEKWYTQDKEYLSTGFIKGQHEFDYNGWRQIEPPTLTKDFAGVGSRDIENYNTLDKETNKWTPRKEYKGLAKENAAKQAIRDLYQRTQDSISQSIDPLTIPEGYSVIQDPTTGLIDIFSEEDGLLSDEPYATREEAIAAINEIRSRESNLEKAKNELSKVKTVNIYAGTGENAELSNFAERPFSIVSPIFTEVANKLARFSYPDKFHSVEQAFQYAKIAYSAGESSKLKKIADKIEATKDGAELKKLGNKIPLLDKERWDEDSSKIMKQLIWASFNRNEDAKNKLLATRDAELTHLQDKGKWGTEFPKLLMEVREIFKEEEAKSKPKEVNTISEYPIEIGRFVSYNGNVYIVTQLNANGTVQIYNPGMEGALAKLSVSKAKLTARKETGNIVTYLGDDYLVTGNKTIISLTSNKKMNWSDTDLNRRNILSLAENGVLAVPLTTVKTAPVNDNTLEPQVFKPANKEQENAINVIQDFIQNGDPGQILVVEGKAGTGKTTIVQEAIAPYIKSGKRVLVAALSNKAKLVLEVKLRSRFPGKIESGSIAGILGRSMDTETGMFTQMSDKLPPITKHDVIIIDEASMVNEEAIEMMLDIKRRGAKLIFLGDRGQLPPIRDAVKNPYYKGWSKDQLDNISPVFEATLRASLTERVRQGEDSPILPFADYYWDNSDADKSVLNPVPEGAYKDILTDKGSLVFAQSFGHIFEETIDSFKEGILNEDPNFIKIVTYRNPTRDMYNKEIRDSIFGKDAKQYVEKDIIMFQNGYVTSDYEFVNGEEYSIKEVTEEEDEHTGYKLFKIGVTSPKNANQIIYFHTLNNESKAQFSKDISELFAKAKPMPKGMARKMAYDQAWGLSDSLAKIEHAYAITSHKSQGSTYDNVIVDVQDILGVGPTSFKNKSQSIYTALTRAKNAAIVVTNKATTVPGNTSKALNMSFKEENKKPAKQIEADVKALYDKHSAALLRADKTLTYDKFKSLPKEEQDKLIECYG